jgi:protein transport protein SEC31
VFGVCPLPAGTGWPSVIGTGERGIAPARGEGGPPSACGAPPVCPPGEFPPFGFLATAPEPAVGVVERPGPNDDDPPTTAGGLDAAPPLPPTPASCRGTIPVATPPPTPVPAIGGSCVPGNPFPSGPLSSAPVDKPPLPLEIPISFPGPPPGAFPEAFPPDSRPTPPDAASPVAPFRSEPAPPVPLNATPTGPGAPADIPLPVSPVPVPPVEMADDGLLEASNRPPPLPPGTPDGPRFGMPAPATPGVPPPPG